MVVAFFHGSGRGGVTADRLVEVMRRYGREARLPGA